MKKVLITGVMGFTGRYLAAELAQAGYRVEGLTHKAHPAEPLASVAITHVCDLNDAAGLQALIARVKPDMVAHLAAISFVGHGDVDMIYHANLLGTRHLLEALAASPHRPEAVLLASSANVYGNARAGAIDESTPPGPANDYAVSKLAMEHVAHLYAGRLPLIIARPFNYTGIGQPPQFLVPKIVDHFRRRAAMIELGNLDVARDFSDVRQVVACYRRLLQTPAAIGGTYNVCSGRHHSLLEIVGMLETLSGHRMEVRVNPAFVRANEVRILHGDRTLLDRTIGPSDDIPLIDTLRWMLDAGDQATG